MIFTILAFMALIICVVAAFTDFCALRLPNILMIILLAIYCQMAFAYYMDGQQGRIASDLFSGGMLFVITAGLFAGGILGAGDAKMISIAGLMVGLQGLPHFLLVMSVVGLVLALTAAILRKKIKDQRFYESIPFFLKPAGGWFARLHRGENAIPYGIAITAGIFAAYHSNGTLTSVL